MKNIRNSVLAALQNQTWATVDKIIDWKNTAKALEQMEKTVFSNLAIVMGDLVTKSERFSHAYLKQQHTLKLLLVYKTDVGYLGSIDDLDTLHDLITGNNFNLSDVATASISNITEWTKFNDKLYYKEIDVEILGFENVNVTNVDNYSLQPFYFTNNTLGYLTVIEQ